MTIISIAAAWSIAAFGDKGRSS